MEELYTIREVAKKLKISTSYVYRYIESGRLQHIRIGSNIWLNNEHISAFLSGAQTKPNNFLFPSSAELQAIYDQF